MKHTLYELPKKLEELNEGDLFKIKGQRYNWEYYDTNNSFYFIRNTLTKQMIALEKLP